MLVHRTNTVNNVPEICREQVNCPDLYHMICPVLLSAMVETVEPIKEPLASAGGSFV